jgi:uncharacterized protein YjiS (DUF1127 family)
MPLKALTLPASVRVNGTPLPRAWIRRTTMTATSFTSSTPLRPAMSGVFGRFVRRIPTWMRAVAANWDRRAAMKALHQLDDRALRDIGLSRCQIERAVHGLDLPDLARF